MKEGSHNKTNRTKRAVSYVRVASRDPSDQRSAVARQVEVCRRRAQAVGAEAIEEYADLGASGGDPHRPQLQALLRRLRRSPYVHYVVVAGLDRLARSLRGQAEVIYEIERTGATVLAPQDSQGSPGKRLKLGILVGFAHWQSEERSRQAMRRREARQSASRRSPAKGGQAAA